MAGTLYLPQIPLEFPSMATIVIETGTRDSSQNMIYQEPEHTFTHLNGDRVTAGLSQCPAFNSILDLIARATF